MLPTEPTFERVALNRATFGARDTDEAYVDKIGWPAWVAEQLDPLAGDDPALAEHLANQLMHIEYQAGETPDGSWPEVNEDRPLVSLTASAEELWEISLNAGVTLSYNELSRLRQEVNSTTWIRAAHSRYQLREVMVDFWHNHFSIDGRGGGRKLTASLPLYDRDIIRPHVFGNFRAMLEAVASSPAMLLFLDNARSFADHPNENYAREMLELHTLGVDMYRGKTPDTVSPTELFGEFEVPGFTDQDVVEASRAFSGWTLEIGQRHVDNTRLPNTGRFFFNENQHHNGAGDFLGEPLSPLAGSLEQGQRVLDIVAYHPGAAQFICTKICRRLFGDPVPNAVVERAITTWMDNQQAPDQIKKVMEAILLDGDEIGALPPQKVRRPFERLMAYVRTTGMVVNAHPWFNYMLNSVKDGIYQWPMPDGRPEEDDYWLTTVATLTTWNLMVSLPHFKAIQSSLYDQTPDNVQSSVILTIEYWASRMLGFEPGGNAMNGLINDAMSARGGLSNSLPTKNPGRIDTSLRQLVALIATTEEFTYR
jgi:uncharacterized protein (DUF1800 family)